MPKAIISNKIYLDTTKEVKKSLIKALTYRIKKPPRPGLTAFSMYDIVKNYKILPNNVMSIPVGRQDLIPEGYEVVDKRILHELPFPTPRIQLRESQQAVYDDVDDLCFINAMVGWGKTFTALHIAKKLGQKTLVVCHTTMLRDQWIEEAEALFNMPIGVIGSGKFDIDHSLVIGNIQTLTKVLPQITKEFGTVIVDEAHHCPASTFTDFINGMYARYKIGLSGTMSRKDGRQVLFKDFFGPKLHQPAQSGTMIPSVRIMQTGIALSPGDPWVQKINKLLYDPDYQHFIAGVAQIQMDKGHKVLIIADRIDFLTKMGELIGEKCVCIVGGTTFEERKLLKGQIESGEKDCVAGSRQIFSEGISVNPLSCLILAGPISAPAGADGLLEQIVGRVMRMYPGKLDPLVIDMNFCGPADRKQNKERLGFYQRKGWDIKGI
jgi:superfamily II DNA or RNA helicase